MKKSGQIVGFSFALVLVVAVGLRNPSGTANAQSVNPCVDSTDQRIRNYRDGYNILASDADTAIARRRSDLMLPTLSANQVLIVADTTACRAASIAYDAELGRSKPDVPAMVLQLATKRIVIKDDGTNPDIPVNILFNQDFTQVINKIWY
jgi:hypothetical protein